MDRTPSHHANAQILSVPMRLKVGSSPSEAKGKSALTPSGATATALDSPHIAAVEVSVPSRYSQEKKTLKGSVPNNSQFSKVPKQVSSYDAISDILTAKCYSVRPMRCAEGHCYVTSAKDQTSKDMMCLASGCELEASASFVSQNKFSPTRNDEVDAMRSKCVLVSASSALGSASSTDDESSPATTRMPLHLPVRSQTPPLQVEPISRRSADSAVFLGGCAASGPSQKSIQSSEIPSSGLPQHEPPTATAAESAKLTPPPLAARHRPRLSLSAYRKPHAAVRLTHADPARSIHQDYDLSAPNSRVLGHGASSTVRLAVRRSDGAKVAVKSIAKHDVLFSRRGASSHRGGRSRRKRTLLDECDILSRLSGDPHVVGLLDTFETDDEVQLVLEYCSGGELFDAIHRRRRRSGRTGGSGYSEAQAARIARQLLSALRNMHEMGVVHRDVKPENVLLLSDDEDETRVRLSDFGLARVLHTFPEKRDSETSSSAYEYSPPSLDGSSSEESEGESSIATFRRSRAYSRVGSDYYTAPEVMSGAGYDTAVDLYSLGVTLYILLCGFPPREHVSSDSSGSSSEDNDEDHSVEFPGSYWSSVSEEAKDLVRRMMDPNAVLRITAADALRHEWIARHCDRAPPLSPEPKAESAELCRNARVGRYVVPKKVTAAPSRPSSRKRSCSIERTGAKRSRSCSAEPRDGSQNASAPAALPFARSMAISMADLLSRMSAIAADASAAAADLIDSDTEDESGAASGAIKGAAKRPASPFASVLTPLSV